MISLPAALVFGLVLIGLGFWLGWEIAQERAYRSLCAFEAELAARTAMASLRGCRKGLTHARELHERLLRKTK